MNLELSGVAGPAPAAADPVALLMRARELLHAAATVHLPAVQAVRQQLPAQPPAAEAELQEALLALHAAATALDLAAFTEDAFQLRDGRIRAGAERLQAGLITVSWHAHALDSLAQACAREHERAEAACRVHLLDLQLETRRLAGVLRQAQEALDGAETQLDAGAAPATQALRDQHARLDAMRRSAEAALQLSQKIAEGRRSLSQSLQAWALRPVNQLQERLRPLAEQPEECTDARAAHAARNDLQFGLVQASALVARLLRWQDLRAMRLGAVAWADSAFS